MYKITFEDGSTFINKSNDLLNSKWAEIPNKPILRLEYTLLNKTIIGEKYEAYNHCVERKMTAFFGEKIFKVILMFKRENKIEKAIFDFENKKLYKEISDVGKEYNNKPTTGWKIGITLH